MFSWNSNFWVHEFKSQFVERDWWYNWRRLCLHSNEYSTICYAFCSSIYWFLRKRKALRRSCLNQIWIILFRSKNTFLVIKSLYSLLPFQKSFFCIGCFLFDWSRCVTRTGCFNKLDHNNLCFILSTCW